MTVKSSKGSPPDRLPPTQVTGGSPPEPERGPSAALLWRADPGSADGFAVPPERYWSIARGNRRISSISAAYRKRSAAERLGLACTAPSGPAKFASFSTMGPTMDPRWLKCRADHLWRRSGRSTRPTNETPAPILQPELTRTGTWFTAHGAPITGPKADYIPDTAPPDSTDPAAEASFAHSRPTTVSRAPAACARRYFPLRERRIGEIASFGFAAAADAFTGSPQVMRGPARRTSRVRRNHPGFGPIAGPSQHKPRRTARNSG